jgi:transcriptional regulator with XRE-family HTH domain
MQIGEELRRLRKMRRLTLSDVSDKTGLSISFLSDMERNRTKPSLDTLAKLADCYQVPVNEVIAGAEAEPEEVKPYLPPGYQEMLEELGERIDPAVAELLLQVEHRAQRRHETKEDWLQFYYSLKSTLGR